MAYDPSIFNVSPYYDDYDPNNGFLRILFKPGYAIQARELTQLQSILQNQISKIGDHLFKDGSRIVGAPITVRNTNFLGLKTGTGTPFSAFGTNDWNSLVNGTIYLGATASAKIAHVLPPETDDKLFVVVDYVSGYSQQLPTNGVTVGITTSNGVGYSPFVPSGASHNGLCKLVTVGDGIFYINGMFALNNEQSFTPFNVSGGYRDLSCSSGGVTFGGLDKKVGFSITRDTTTSSEDTSLLDPSFGSPNYKAPGADRFVVNLELDQSDLNTTPDDFVELLKFEDGLVTKKIDKVVYGDIAKTLAQRTYDESGSYLVNPFDISVREASVSENLNLIIGPGKAYVYGTEVETKYPTILGISKGRSVDSTVNDASFIFNTGNVLGVCLDRTASGSTAYTYFNNVNGGSGLVRFRNSGGSVIGEARIHGLIPRNSGVTSSLYSMYLYGVSGGSVISGASSAAVYGSPSGASAGITFGVFYPINGSTFGLIGGSAANDSCLVYEISPTQGISAFTELSFYGKIATKSSASWGQGVTYNATNQSATYTVGNSDLDLPSEFPTSNISLISELPSTPSSSLSLLSNYTLVNNSGIAMSPSSLFVSNSNSGVSIKKDGSNRVSLLTQNTPVGFTGASGTAVRMVLPYKYTISTANFSTASGVSGSCRTKTATTNIINSTVYSITNINGRYGFTLPHWDVYSVRSITFGGSNVLADFELDDGQKESFYDYSAIVAKKTKESTYASTAQTVSITYNYFRHGGTVFAPFVGHHSYIGISYDQVPLFTNPKTGRTVSLSNCVDFRHSGPTLDTIISKPYGDYESLNPTNAKWYNYLPRIDRVGIKVNPSDFSTSFVVDKGISELAPQSPPETENSMTLATVMVPAFTYRPTDVVVNRTNVRRYSMSDINSVEKRIDDMEVFTKLSLSESEMASENVKPLVDGFVANGGSTSGVYALTSEPIKTSIYTDDFYGHAGGDVSDTDHRCSVDYQYGELRPMFTHKFLSLSAAPTISSGATVSSDGLVTLDYTTSAHITNDGYNKSIGINPTGTVNWLGFIRFTDGYETAFDTGVRPVVYNNNMMENDNWIGSNANNARGFGTQWNDWEYLWSGTQIRADQKDDIQKKILETPRTNSSSLIPTVNSGNEKTSVARDFYQPDRKHGNLVNSNRLVGRAIYRTPDNRIVDKTVVPYIPLPSSPIGITAYGLRPNSSGLNLYVDGVLLKSGLTTNSNGTVGLTFTFSSETHTSGEKAIRISDSANAQTTTQAADAIFYCGGTVRQRFDGVYSTRNPEYRRQTVTSEGVIKDPFNREVSYDNIQETITSNTWTDPLCQTFIVDKKGYPEGIFVSSISLYFDTKDSNLPVTIQLRPTINGYPSPSVSFPFSTVTLMPSQVSTGYVGNSTTPVATEFRFTSPVYLEPGEYAIAILTNSKDYTLRAYDSGLNLTNTGRGGNPAVGTLYSPQSMGPAVPDLNTDISFSVNRCEFTISSSSDVSYSGLDVTDCQVLKVSVPQIVPTNTSSSISIDSGTKTILNNQNEYLNTVYTVNKDIKFSMTKSKNYISPAIDTGVFFGIGASMIVTDNTSLASPTSSYVSKAISLPEELISTGVFASAEVCCPYRSEVRAYIRFVERGESDLFSKNWIQMVAIGGIGSYKYPFTASSNLSSTEFDFRPTQWAYFNTSSTIRAYQIKLVMTTSTTGDTKTYSVLPAVRNLRMASLRTV